MKVKMEFLELAGARYSVRKFDGTKPVEKEKLDKILEAGRIAPTGCNYQPQRILVIQNKEKLEALRKATPYIYGAPVVLVLCYDWKEVWSGRGGKEGGDVDCTIVGTQMMYEAEEQGLGTLWVGSFDPEALREIAGIPEFLEPSMMMDIGYRREDCHPARSLHFNRKPLSETVFYENFEGAVPGKDNH